MSGLRQTLARRVQLHLGMARVGNLPGIWSNCIAGWALVGGVFVPSLFMLLAGVSLIHVGAMYLNDALDAPWDVEHHRDRPIPRGEITQKLVLAFGAGLLIAGPALIWGEGWLPFLLAVALSAVNVGYNFFHRRIGWSPILLGLARALIYLTVASAAATKLTGQLVLWAGAIGAYTIGIAFASKEEERSSLKRNLPLALTLLPIFLNSYKNVRFIPSILSFAMAGWLAYGIFFLLMPKFRNRKRASQVLLAGISLVDLLAVSQLPAPFLWQVLCGAMFALTFGFHRWTAMKSAPR